MASRSFQITQDLFNNSLMRISMSMHKLTNFMHYITYIRPHESKILKSTNNLFVISRIKVQGTRHYDQLKGRKCRSINRFIRRHIGFMKNVKIILLLSKHETYKNMLNFNS